MTRTAFKASRGRHAGSLADACDGVGTGRLHGSAKISPVRYSHLILTTVALFGAWQFVSSRPIERDPGEIAAADPLQSELPRR